MNIDHAYPLPRWIYKARNARRYASPRNRTTALFLLHFGQNCDRRAARDAFGTFHP